MEIVICTSTPPVRAEVPALVATPKVPVPLLEPELLLVIASHAALVVAVQETFADTAMERPLHAALDTFVLVGLMFSDAAADDVYIPELYALYELLPLVFVDLIQ